MANEQYFMLPGILKISATGELKLLNTVEKIRELVKAVDGYAQYSPVVELAIANAELTEKCSKMLLENYNILQQVKRIEKKVGELNSHTDKVFNEILVEVQQKIKQLNGG